MTEARQYLDCRTRAEARDPSDPPQGSQHRVGLSRSTIYRWIAEGRFPKPVQLGGYAVAWAEDEIQNWIALRLD
jgi:predicted DNA-binding transcriptional regulator AlpA